MLVMCIGNRNNGDDGVGPYIASLFPKVKGLKVVNCETVPENFVHLTRKVRKVVLIDAVDMNLPPGEIRLVPKEKIPKGSVSTHNIPLSMLMEYLEREGKEVVLIGIQPKKFEGELSNEVRVAAKKLVNMIVNNEKLEVLK